MPESQKSIKNDAEEYLGWACPHVAGLAGAELAKAMKRRQWTPGSHSDKISFVAIVYALVCLHGRDEETLGAIKSKLAPQPSTLDPVRIFVQGNYLMGDGLEADTRKARNLFSRYVGAARYIHSQQMLPSKVVELSKVKGEGVNEWDKRNAAQKKGAAIPVTVQASPATFTIKFEGKKQVWTSTNAALKKSWITSLNKKATAVLKKPKL